MDLLPVLIIVVIEFGPLIMGVYPARVLMIWRLIKKVTCMRLVLLSQMGSHHPDLFKVFWEVRMMPLSLNSILTATEYGQLTMAEPTRIMQKLLPVIIKITSSLEV